MGFWIFTKVSTIDQVTWFCLSHDFWKYGHRQLMRISLTYGSLASILQRHILWFLSNWATGNQDLRDTAQFVLNRYHNTSCVSRMLDSLQWPSLESRRSNAWHIMLYKTHHQTVACPLIQSKLLAAPKRQRWGHDQQCQLATPKTEYRRGSFVPRTIREWND